MAGTGKPARCRSGPNQAPGFAGATASLRVLGVQPCGKRRHGNLSCYCTGFLNIQGIDALFCEFEGFSLHWSAAADVGTFTLIADRWYILPCEQCGLVVGEGLSQYQRHSLSASVMVGIGIKERKLSGKWRSHVESYSYRFLSGSFGSHDCFGCVGAFCSPGVAALLGFVAGTGFLFGRITGSGRFGRGLLR